MGNVWRESTLALAPQTGGFGTFADPSVGANWRALLAEKVKVTLVTPVTEMELMTGRIGAAAKRIVGARSGTIAFKMPLEGFVDGYDPTDPGPDTVPHWYCLLANMLGSNSDSEASASDFWAGMATVLASYRESGVDGATDTVVTCDSSGDADAMPSGALVLAASNPDSLTAQLGFLKSKAGLNLTLVDPAANAAAGGANLYPAATAWLSPKCLSPIPLSAMWRGQDSEFAYLLQDIFLNSAKLTWEAGAVPTIEFSGKFYDYMVDKTRGGLVEPADHAQIPQIVGALNGRATINGAVTDGLESCTVEYKCDLQEIKSHSGDQGIGAVLINKPRVSATFSIPHFSDDAVKDDNDNDADLGHHRWQSMLQQGQTFSLGCYVAAQPGRCFAFLIPAAELVAVPAVEDRAGIIAYTLSVEAAKYSGDSTDTADTPSTTPINSMFRIGLG